MKIHTAKLLATVACFALLFSSAATTEAGLVDGLWNALFGCGGCSGGGAAYYGPSGGCSSGGCGVSTYYAPVRWSNCSPCDSGCSTCSIGTCDPCVSGNCSVGSSAGTSSESTSGGDSTWKGKSGEPRTYDPKSERDLGTPEKPRTKPDAGLDRGNSKPNVLNEDGESAGAFKPPISSGDTGTVSPAGEKTPINPKAGKKSVPVPRIGDDDEDKDKDAQRKLPKVNLDEKIAWRPAPERKRVELKPQVANARLIRVPEYARTDWLPVTTDANVARK